MKEIPLSKGKVALIDDEDFDLVSQFTWWVRKDCNIWYAVTEKQENKIIHKTSMHRLIMQAVPGMIIDHANRNGLDNRRSNLRFATSSQNRVNAQSISKNKDHKGVYHNECSGTWMAVIKFEHKVYRMGGCSTEKEAAQLYDAAARILHKEFAILNYPDLFDEEIAKMAYEVVVNGIPAYKQRLMAKYGVYCPPSYLAASECERCTVSGCVRKIKALGVCKMHYARMYPEKYGRKRMLKKMQLSQQNVGM